MEHSQNERVKKKKRYQQIKFARKFTKWNHYFGPLVLAALQCCCGDKRNKMRSSFKTLVSSNAATWPLHQSIR